MRHSFAPMLDSAGPVSKCPGPARAQFDQGSPKKSTKAAGTWSKAMPAAIIRKSSKCKIEPVEWFPTIDVLSFFLHFPDQIVQHTDLVQQFPNGLVGAVHGFGCFRRQAVDFIQANLDLVACCGLLFRGCGD